MLAAFLLSLCIELLQPLLTTNRTSDITDVIANTAGGLAGYLLFLPVGRPLLRLCRERKSRRRRGDPARRLCRVIQMDSPRHA